MRWLLIPAALGLCALALFSCSTNPATGRASFTGMMTTADEVKIGREQNEKLLEAFGGAYDDPALAAYVSTIGNKLAAKAERSDITYTFTVLNSPIVNALALPGGYIYVTRGLLALVGNEAELAGVVGHEIGHVTARHHAQRQSSQTVAGVASLGVSILGAIAGLPLGHGTQMLAGAFLASYTRDQEYEADLLGIRYLNAAGYDPKAMASFLAKLNGWTVLEQTIMGADSTDRLDYLATHPNTEDRVRQALAAAGLSPAANAPMVGTNAYLDRVDGILFGEPIASGVIRGRTFMHPELRLRFAVPLDYELFDSPQAVYAVGPGNGQIVFSSVQMFRCSSLWPRARRKWAWRKRPPSSSTNSKPRPPGCGSRPIAATWISESSSSASIPPGSTDFASSFPKAPCPRCCRRSNKPRSPASPP
jgi:predicted Zn-dependent protease